MADDSALVLVGPDDTVDTIIQKVRDAGTRSVELLVADGATALQSVGGLSRLHASAAEQNTRMLLIASDEKTLDAARLAQIDAVSVLGGPVIAPPRPVESINPYSTRPLPAVDLTSDDELLKALDEDTRPSRRSTSAASDTTSDEDILATLDSFADFPDEKTNTATFERDRHTPVFNDRDQDYAAELDAWGDMSDDSELDAPPREIATAPPERPTRRVRPEDIDLDDDDLDRVRTRERRTQPRRAAVAPEERRRRRVAYEDEYDAPPVRRSGNPLLTWIPVLLILLLVAAGAYWLYSNRATVVVRPPIPVTEETAFENQVIPLSKDPVDDQSPAVQAIDVRSDVQFSAQGTVASETVTPRNFAKGVVTILNSANTPFDLPQGMEFIATNGQGQDVRFVSDAGVTVPPATTSDNGAQIVTQRGQAQVNVTARQPGSNSNVDANTVKQIAFPGQAPAPANAGSLLVQNAPLTGGDEQPVRVVTEQDVQLVLQQALTGLYEQGIRTLGEQANAAGGSWSLEQTTVEPRPEDLSRVGDGQVFELSVNPPIGQEVPPETPVFSVTVKTAFNALAVPSDKPLPEQLATSVPRQLVIGGTLKPGLAPTITAWHWDGSRLFVSGVLKPTQTTSTIDAQTRAAILEALRGKSRADAIAILEDYKQKGIISDYTLPDRDQLPSLSFQLNLQVE